MGNQVSIPDPGKVRYEPADDDVHAFFGLTYANYLVLHRTLLQSMPGEWQRRFVVMIRELDAAFDHIEKPDSFKVEAAEEHEAGGLTDAQLAAAGITAEELPCAEDHDHAEDEGADCWMPRQFTDEDGLVLGRDRAERVLVPVRDPVPHYNRGRTRVEPRLPLSYDETHRGGLTDG